MIGIKLLLRLNEPVQDHRSEDLYKGKNTMGNYAIITQNDESPWIDIKGDLYHYPNRYKNILTPGCKVIYYKSAMKNKTFLLDRLSPQPHYFGIGVIGKSILDRESDKTDWYCEVLEYQEFEKAVPNKTDNIYFEEIPNSRKSNYWRDGVREITKAVYEKILNQTILKEHMLSLPNDNEEFESYGPTEGNKKQRYTSYYERNPFYRNKAIEIHGLSCMACKFNFEETYGAFGGGFIHVHHNTPISETGPTYINPQTDLSVLCPNCHAMVHRRKNNTLTMEQLGKLTNDKKLPY